jgi:hypothetical protein
MLDTLPLAAFDCDCPTILIFLIAKRRLSKRRDVAQFPSQPVRGPGWKEERDDPWHRRPPLRNRHFPRRGKPGLVDANGAVTDENTRQFLQGFVEQFAALLARLSFALAAAALD